MNNLNLKNSGIAINLVHELTLGHQEAVWVTSDKDYVMACKLLADFKEGSPGFNVFVRQKVYYLWLQDFAKQINLLPTFSEKTARDLLSDSWKVTLPDWLDDKDILFQNLLDIKIPEKIPPDFVSAMLVMFFGEIFNRKILNPEHVVELLEALLKPEKKETLIKYPILDRCLSERFQEWSLASDSSWLEDLIEEMRRDSDQVWENLSIWSLLSGYPEKLLEFAIPLGQALTIKKVPPKVLSSLKLNRTGTQQAIDQVEFYFKDIQEGIDSNEAFRSLIKQISGKLKEEFEFLVSLLKSNKFTPEKEDIELIQKKFQDCPGLSRIKVSNLMNFVPVAEPPALLHGETWDFNKWVVWTTQEYLPFRQWLINHQHGNPIVEETVQGFTDWYIKDYAILHQNNEISLTHTLNYWKQSIDQDDLVFLVLIDCLPANYWAILEDCMRKARFFPQQLEYRLAPLPSETKNNKPLLISGNWEFGGSDYQQLFAQRIGRDWPKKKFYYHTSLKELSEMECPPGPAIIAINFYSSDEVLHSDVSVVGSTYEEELQRLFFNLGETLRSFSDRWTGDPTKFSIYILTDHGATRLLDEETKSFSAKIVNKLFPTEKYRYGQIKDNEANQIPQNLWDFGYRFKPPFLSEDFLFFIPRGHNTVKTGGIGSYKHGGATPEEVIVPVGIFKASPIPWKDPELRLLSDREATPGGRVVFYVKRLTKISIEIQNKNPEPLKVVHIEVLKPSCDLKNYDRPSVPPQSQAIMNLECYFPMKDPIETELILEVGYEAQGEERAVLINTPVEFKTAVTGGFSLKDLKAN